MLFDAQNLFSDQQSLAADAGAFFSTNVIDLGETGAMAGGGSPISDPGRGLPIEVLVQITDAVLSAGAATVKFELVMADNDELTSNLVVLYDSGALGKAALVPGYQVRLRALPPGVAKRYLGVRYTVAVATTTAGKVTAGIVEARQTAGLV